MGQSEKAAAKEDDVGGSATGPLARLHRFDVLAAWFTEHLAIGNYRPRTVRDYAFEVSFFRRWLLLHTELPDIDELTPQVLHDYAAGLYGRGLATTSIHHKLAVVSVFLGTLYDSHKLYIDMRGHVRLPRLARRLPRDIMTEEEVARVLQWLEERTAGLDPSRPRQAVQIRDHAIVEVLYSTGLRKAELMQLHLDDVNYDDGMIVVREGKGGKDRVVPIGHAGLAALRRYLKAARPVLARKDTPQVFVSINGGSMDHNAVLECVRRAVKAAGIARGAHPHTLRHCCATHMLNHGADIRYVQELLGHTCLASTQVYTHVSIGKLKQTHRRCHPREQPRFMATPQEE